MNLGLQFRLCVHAYAQAWENFCTRYPALLYGFCLWLTCSGVYGEWNSALTTCLAFLLLSASLSRSAKLWKRYGLALILSLACYLSASASYQKPSSDTLGEGSAVLVVDQVRASHRHGKPLWLYRGTVLSWQSRSSPMTAARNFQISLSQSAQKERLRTDRVYQVHGNLKQTRSGSYRLSVPAKATWVERGSRFSFGELRIHAKQSLSNCLDRLFSDRTVRLFMGGIATGDFDDQVLVQQFGRFGLQHIMAISGFHFGIIASILGLLMRSFLSPRHVALTLVVLLSSYYLFIGCAPSVERAWVTALCALIAQLTHRRATSLNVLGVAMLVILLTTPQAAVQLGFQFSFLTTAAILLLYPPVEKSLRSVWPKRSLSLAIQLSPLSQHGYLVSTFIRHSVALCIAVHLVALPLLLFLFQKFPLLSLLYNLFYPLLVSLSMFLLLISLILWLAYPSLALAVSAVNEVYSRWMLGLVTEMPLSVDFMIRCPRPPLEALTLGLLGLLILAVVLHQRTVSRQATLIC